MKYPGILLAVGVVALAGSADGRPTPKHNPWLDVPRMQDVGNVDPKEHSWMTATCTPIKGTRPRRASCTYVQTLLFPPDPKDTQQSIAELEKGKKRKAPGDLKLFHSMCKNLAKTKKAYAKNGQLTIYQGFLNRVAQACASKDFAVFVDAIEWSTKNIDAHTCKHFTQSWTEVFTQQDANTWIATQYLPGGCYAAETKMFWRKPGQRILWNYRDVPTPAANPPKDLCAGASGKTMEWRWNNTHRLVDAGCKYVEY